ncbi:MAG TPA: VOC family protein [Methylomirabilota bacterium]|jgi:PhnB protein|nr:VOC family protein [Methylomirabilota bacterium]
MAKAIPDGYRTVTPYLTVKGAAQAIDFYKRAFGARESERMTGPDGKSVMHAEIQIGDSLVMLSDEFPQMGSRSPQTLGGTTAAIFLYVPDVDAAFQQAVDAGAKAIMPPADMFWGDRFGKLVDPFGHEWAMATHKEDLAPEEIRKRGAAAMASMCSDAGHPS